MPILSPGAGSCVVSGNLNLLTGSAAQYGQVIFRLGNLGTYQVPRVIGKAIFPALVYVVSTDVTGTFSINLWGNDQIDPANTIYYITFLDQYGNQTGPYQFYINGNAFNLNTATAMSITSLPIYSSLGFATGTKLTAGNFTLTGWGTGASITNVAGTEMGFVITVQAGSGPLTTPTITLNYPTAYPNAPMVMAFMYGGTGVTSDIAVTQSTTNAVYAYGSLPVNGKTYSIASFTLGI